MKTKSLIITLVALIGLCSCGQSKEEKAQEMAANYLKGVLYHFDSYEPLQTKVDSSFVALSTDREAIELTLDMLKLFQSAQEYADKIESAESSMEIWSPSGYSSAYSKGEYRRAKEERDNNQRLLDKTKDRIQNQFSKIKSRQSYLEAEALLKIGDFNGWKVYHKFKSLNGAGTLDLFGEYVFFCDEDFNEKSAYPKEDYEAISKVMIAISSSNDISDMIEKVQEEIY
ncbi:MULTISPECIES: hypothetical protein [Bacteroidales]|jgi:hypothetical protein|nr:MULTISPECIES: hypothetical protein [Bacteroidales]NCE70973.1 hypothetical protein [Muribaculaceae bacterium M3]ROS82482.1 hypothetical protein EEK90_11215 [Muribaculaceae bacterium Isolate-036 (Harlan)]